MNDLIAKLVPPKQQAHAQRLLEDPGSQNLIRQQLTRTPRLGKHTRPRVWLDAPRVQPLCARTFTRHPELFVRPRFSARARKTARGARALLIQLRSSGLSQLADDHAGLVPQKSFCWIVCKLTTFGADETDTLRIYQAFLSQLNQLGQMCRLLSGEGINCKFDPPATVASRIMIGLGLFHAQVARRHRYHAAPSPQYYQRMAAGCFARTGYETIAAKLPEWLEFLRANFMLPRM